MMKWRPMRFRWWPDLALALALVAATTPASATEIAPDAGKLANLVRQDCGSCHGLTLRGGLGKPLTSENMKIWNREQLVSIILDGVPGTPMPPWRALLSEADARWIADRLQQGNLP
ncbi:MAG TPA: cytochrome c [Bradyrhizobium sp.]|jgi:cytochrome c55X